MCIPASPFGSPALVVCTVALTSYRHVRLRSRTVGVDSLAGGSARDDAVQNGNVQQHQQQQSSPGQVESRAGTSEATQGYDVALALGGNASLLSEKASEDMRGVHTRFVRIIFTCCLGQ